MRFAHRDRSRPANASKQILMPSLNQLAPELWLQIVQYLNLTDLSDLLPKPWQTPALGPSSSTSDLVIREITFVA